MDSPRVKEYKKQIQTLFSRAKVHGFVDWRHMGPLESGVLDLLDDARQELSAPEDRWDLFAVANAVFLKWGKTDMDDDGDTQMVMDEVTDAWDDVICRLADEKEQKKALDFFMKNTDGKVIDYVENYLYQFMDTHFRTPEFLKIKRSFLEDKIRQVESSDKDDFLKECDKTDLKEYLLQVLSDEGAPIEEVEAYAKTVGRQDISDRMLRIYEERGEIEREIALLRKIIEEQKGRPFRSFSYKKYEMKLKDIYQRTGRAEEHYALLRQMFYEYPGNDELYKEYRATFSDDGWCDEAEQHLFPAVIGRYDAMSLFEKEKRYDLMMDTAERAGDFYGYEKVLKKRYPERCLKILAMKADEEMELATQRKGYRKVARVLKKMLGYPGGESVAKELAEKYRKEYPRRPALWEELERF
ncbi:MAG: hypothetical protein I3I98_03685 [Mobilibacterium timonense]|uniref:hypothetical protein n=1 Tax=Mobilibacterium timonense TaxID=1871012 RepID=UPI002352664B|nr:hypothetical protein [Mobilibacterium timonense]MBM6990496.1 hypothetical protein [Mobilibacterium timonense]